MTETNNTRTITLWVYIQNNGDGSAVARFFNTREEAEARHNEDDKEYGECFCDDVYAETLIFDLITGRLVDKIR